MGESKTETPLRQLVGWLTQAQTLLAVIVAVAGLVAQVLPGFQAALLGWIALVLTALAVAWLAFSARRAWTKPKPAPRRDESPAVQIRGAKPFEDGDELMGRNREISELFTTVRALEFRFGYLSGQAGAGKTSLLRAGLTKRLRREAPQWTFVYVPRAGARPDLEILKALKAKFPGLIPDSSALSDACRQIVPTLEAPLLIACDQFEEFFLTARSAESREVVISELRTLWDLSRDDGRLRLLLCLRKEFVDDLLSLARSLPELRIQDWRCSLSNLTLEATSEMLDQLVESGEISMSAQLRRRVASDLAHDGFVRPVELQIVLSRLLEYRIRDLPAYGQRGGAFRILSRFIAETIDPPDKEVKEIDRQVGRHLLRALCADNFAARRPRGLTEASLVERVREQLRASAGGTTFSKEEVSRSIPGLIAEFRHARVLIDEGEERINLAHDYLAAAVRDATADIESAEERANRLLDQYVSQARLSRSTVLPFRVLRNVNRYASAETLGRTEARQLISRSRRRHSATVATALLIAFVAVTLVLPFGWQAHVAERISQRSLEIVPMKALALVGENNSARRRLFDYDKGEEIATFEALRYEISPTGESILLLGSDGSIAVARAAENYSPRVLLPRTGWNADPGFQRIMGFAPNSEKGFALAANGDLYIWVDTGRPRRLAQLSLPTQERTILPPQGSRASPSVAGAPAVTHIHFSPDGRYLLVMPESSNFLGSEGGEAWLLDTTRTYATLPSSFGRLSGYDATFAFSADGKYFAWSERGSSRLSVGELPDLSTRVIIPFARNPDFELISGLWGMWFSPDSHWLVARHRQGGFDQWRVGTAPRLTRVVDASREFGSDRLIPPSFDGAIRYVFGTSPVGVHLWQLERPGNPRRGPLLAESESLFGETSQTATFCPESESGMLAAANGTLHRIASPDNPRLESAGQRMLGQVTLVPAQDADFIFAFSVSELAFGPCSDGALEFLRFDHRIEHIVLGADRRDLFVVDVEGFSRVRWSFMLWGLPVYSSAFPPIQRDPSGL